MPSQRQGTHTDRDLVYPRKTQSLGQGLLEGHIHKLWKFGDHNGGLFAHYVDTWLKVKTEASGWPAGCDTPTQRLAYVAAFEQTEGIQLDPAKIMKNSGLHSLAKLM